MNTASESINNKSIDILYGDRRLVSRSCPFCSGVHSIEVTTPETDEIYATALTSVNKSIEGCDLDNPTESDDTHA